jgi:hypothetical protein
MHGHSQPIPILLFADSILGIQPYDWQCKILLNYEAGFPTAAACANFTGKTSTVFPIAALWTLYSFPRARLMYLSATGQQVKNQFFSSLNRFNRSYSSADFQAFARASGYDEDTINSLAFQSINVPSDGVIRLHVPMWR